MLDKYKGCLIGGAAGDALGGAVEFWPRARIIKHYGEPGITRFKLVHGKALITDDTQMTLFTAAGLCFYDTRGKMRGIAAKPQDYIYYSYLDWLHTQFPSDSTPKRISWLLNVGELFADGAPGATCIEALCSGKSGSIEEPINRSKGCGGLMRVAPVALFFAARYIPTPAFKKTLTSFDKLSRKQKAAWIGAQTAAITHDHPLGFIPAAALVYIIITVLQNDYNGKNQPLEQVVLKCIHAVKEMFPKYRETQELVLLMEQSINLASSPVPDADAIAQLGRGWVAEETLAIALFCCLRYPEDFEKAVIASVNHDGDSDSTGAVTGNIMGALLGYDAIPSHFKEDLQLSDVILEMAEGLYTGCPMEEYSEYRDAKWISKYMEMDFKL